MIAAKDNATTTPRPDPTVLTTEQIETAVAALREVLETRIAGNQAVLEERLDGLDVATRLRQAEVDRVPQAVDIKLAAVKDVVYEKFEGVNIRFDGVATQFVQRDIAVQAALQAAKEAVEKQNTSSALAIAKSEDGTDKRINQMGQLNDTNIGALNAKVDDLKERLTAMEGADRGKVDQTKSTMNAASIISIIIGSIIGVSGFGIAIATFITQRHA